MFRWLRSDEEIEDIYFRRHPFLAMQRDYYKRHPHFHKVVSFVSIVVVSMLNLVSIIKNHVPSFYLLSLSLGAYYGYRLAGSDIYTSIISYFRRIEIVNALICVLNLVVFFITIVLTGVYDPFSALYGRIMIEYTDYVSIPYCFDDAIFWSKQDVEKPDDLKSLLKKYTGYDFTSLYKYGYNEKEKEFEIMDYQENLKYTITVRQVNNHYQYFIDEENE